MKSHDEVVTDLKAMLKSPEGRERLRDMSNRGLAASLRLRKVHGQYARDGARVHIYMLRLVRQYEKAEHHVAYKIETDNFTAAVAQLVSQFNEENGGVGSFKCDGVIKKTGDTFKLSITIKQRKAKK